MKDEIWIIQVVHDESCTGVAREGDTVYDGTGGIVGHVIDELRPGDQAEMLAQALLPSRELRRVFRMSAEFNAAVVTLAALLPAWVDGLATKACVANAETRELARKMARGEV